MKNPRRETFKKKERITKRSDFIKRHPKDVVVHTSGYRFVFKPTSLPYSRLGIVVTRRDGNAVFRNRVKRVLREAFRRNKGLIVPPRDVIAIRKRRPEPPSFREAEKSFTEAARKLTHLQKRKSSTAE